MAPRRRPLTQEGAATATEKRGLDKARPGRNVARSAPPSDALAENVAAYRALRRITQGDLAARMTLLGHRMGRSTVSAIEGKHRGVNVDELFGLAISVGVTVGQLLDPTGPDHSRALSFDVGLKTDEGDPRPVAPRLSRLWAASRVVTQVPPSDGRGVEFEAADELEVADQRELERLRDTASR